MSGKNLEPNFPSVSLKGDTEIYAGICPFKVNILSFLYKEFEKTNIFHTDRENYTIIDITIAQ